MEPPISPYTPQTPFSSNLPDDPSSIVAGTPTYSSLQVVTVEPPHYEETTLKTVYSKSPLSPSSSASVHRYPYTTPAGDSPTTSSYFPPKSTDDLMWEDPPFPIPVSSNPGNSNTPNTPESCVPAPSPSPNTSPMPQDPPPVRSTPIPSNTAHDPPKPGAGKSAAVGKDPPPLYKTPDRISAPPRSLSTAHSLNAHTAEGSIPETTPGFPHDHRFPCLLFVARRASVLDRSLPIPDLYGTPLVVEKDRRYWRSPLAPVIYLQEKAGRPMKKRRSISSVRGVSRRHLKTQSGYPRPCKAFFW